MQDKKPLIELKNVVKSYDGKINVVEDISLTIEEGEFVTLLGPSGFGKTTILRMIGGFETITGGQILLDGSDISLLPPNKRPVNTVFQKYALFPHYNVYDNIAYGLKIKKLSKQEMDRKVKEVLELVDLEGFEKRSIDTLSGGQQQRIAIARAIVNEPKVLLLDESLSALDSKMRKEMQVELKNMHKRLGITFIFVTHDQEEALTMSDKVVVVADGMIQQVGTPEEIYNEPANLFVADFIGESNIFEGKVVEKYTASFAGGMFACVDEYEAGTSINAVIRPEDVEVTELENAQIKGQVISADFKGIFYATYVQCGKYEVMMHCQKYYEPGSTIGLRVIPDNVHLIPFDDELNKYEGVVESVASDGIVVRFQDFAATASAEKLIAGSRIVDGRLVDKNNQPIDILGRKLVATFEPQDANMDDDASKGTVVGKILFFHYIGDHYSYTISSESDEYYVVDDADLWNRNDTVGVTIPMDKLNYTLI